MVFKVIELVAIVIVTMVTVGNAIKCHIGGETPTGVKIPEVEFDCSSELYINIILQSLLSFSP